MGRTTNPNGATVRGGSRPCSSAEGKAGSAHHRLPQFYMRGFAGTTGRIDVADRSTGERRSRAPRRAFAEKAHYTIRDENERPLALAEVLYESFEDKAAPLHRRLLEGSHLRHLMRKREATMRSSLPPR
jgi:hypothetical protein